MGQWADEKGQLGSILQLMWVLKKGGGCPEMDGLLMFTLVWFWLRSNRNQGFWCKDFKLNINIGSVWYNQAQILYGVINQKIYLNTLAALGQALAAL